MNAQDPIEPVDVIETETVPDDPGSEIIVPVQPNAPEEAANPDAWLQWALVIGLLALFLICALLIFVAWGDR